jgi:pathogenesis-related protein 1
MLVGILAGGCGGNDLGIGGGGGGGGGDTAGGTEPAAMVGMTAAHNQARAAVSPAPKTPIPVLSWSDKLTQVAQAWADKCQYKHSGGDYGENIFANTGPTATPEVVLASWADEREFYDYASNSCASGQVCGHYTQVVWADTLRIGCGLAHCAKNIPFANMGSKWDLWVCNYDPPGNYVGQKPY